MAEREQSKERPVPLHKPIVCVGTRRSGQPCRRFLGRLVPGSRVQIACPRCGHIAWYGA